MVTLKSGKELFLYNSNDVDNDNRGVVVSVEGTGKIDIPWRSFRSVEFINTESSGKPFDNYKIPKGLMGTVYTFEEETYIGKMIYDLDEAWEVETLEANDNGIDYLIPFWNIKRIIPKNDDYSLIELRNGKNLLLGGTRDVSEDNDGILMVQDKEKDAKYIKWRDVAEIVFD